MGTQDLGQIARDVSNLCAQIGASVTVKALKTTTTMYNSAGEYRSTATAPWTISGSGKMLIQSLKPPPLVREIGGLMFEIKRVGFCSSSFTSLARGRTVWENTTTHWWVLNVDDDQGQRRVEMTNRGPLPV